jgi:Tol biopolymer transport system component
VIARGKRVGARFYRAFTAAWDLRGMTRFALVLPALCAGGLAAATSPALATFPGQNGRIAFDSDRHGGDIDIWTMRPGGGDHRNLTAGSEAVDGAANWRADGRKIVFMSDRETARNPDPRGKQGPDFELFVMNANGSNPRQITDNEVDDEDPAWSPDGSRIVFQRDLNPVRGKVNYDLFTIAADGTDERSLTDSRGVDDFQPNWSSKGRIAFTSDRDGDTDIYSMRGDGSKVRKLTRNKLDEEFPNWSPNGRAIVFHRVRNDNFDVYRMRKGGGGVKRLTSDPAGEGLPAFSPDGRMITFFSESGGSPDLFTMRRGGGGQKNRTSNKAFEFAPDWQPLPR